MMQLQTSPLPITGNALKPIGGSGVSIPMDWEHQSHDPLPRAAAIFFGVCMILAVVVLGVIALW